MNKNRTIKNEFNKDISRNFIEWSVFTNYKEILVAGITTRTTPLSFERNNLKNPYSSFNLGLHVGDNNNKVINSRKKLCQSLKFPFKSYTCANQIHGANVVNVDDTLIGKGRLSIDDAISRCDALITNKPGVLLNIFVADCVPIILFDPVTGCCGAVHAGWRGVASGIVEKTVLKLKSIYGSDPSNLLVGLGPSIDICCFDVKENTALEILKNRDYSEKVIEKRRSKTYIDLRQCLKEQLEKMGVDNKSIEIIPFCTKCNSDLFYSYRASGGKTGRFSGFIGLRDDL